MRRSSAILSTVLVAVACGGTPGPATPENTLVVDTDRGPVMGADHGAYLSYQGIPYAAPPTGERRWAPPQAPPSWTETRDATKPGAQCAQARLDGSPGVQGSEDCLYLNVTRPAKGRKARPVMVWLHGGGFTNGSGNDYDGSRIAVRGDVVVVTVNYRLGVFGFLGLPEFGGKGNFGFADQVAALRWVRTNAAAFGGDPRNVTVFGESAGAMSICSHLTSPDAEGLFDRAVIQSGSCMTAYPKNGISPGVPAYRPWWPKDQVAAMGTATATELGCAGAGGALECLRGRPVEQLATSEVMARASFPAFGVDRLPEDPALALRAGRFHRVPVLQGSNHDEMRFYVGPALAGGLVIDQAGYDELLADSFGADADAVRAAYPAAAYPSPALAWATVLTDAGWSCTTLEADRALAAGTTIYGYEFTDPDAPNFQNIPTVEGFPFGAAHGTELSYLFPFPGVRFTAEQQQLSEAMIDAWARFARSGEPGWPELTIDEPYVRSLVPGAVGRVDLATEHKCDVWDAVSRS
ncbi:carboxylesterase/lipase family protein [Plantactinospora sp. WMMB782]|uniref:carboxylesterase/lipase family protein n=1 Tax=Plantactinospora sp. WMMB782 TaxID=3404121 RepID=UPI003B934C6B